MLSLSPRAGGKTTGCQRPECRWPVVVHIPPPPPAPLDLSPPLRRLLLDPVAPRRALTFVGGHRWDLSGRNGEGGCRSPVMECDGAEIRARDGGGGRKHPAEALKGVAAPDIDDEDTAWQMMNSTQNESMEAAGPFPVRPGEPDCSYFIRTGFCRFGMACRFNHPSTSKLAILATRIGGYPERIGQPECLYYLKAGTCKFGATCKFHHPRDKLGIAGVVQFNISGYPLRPNEEQCAYYLRTGECKFGSNCKFHHPQPPNMAHLSPANSSPRSSASRRQQSYPGSQSSCPMWRPFIPSTRWQGPSTYAPVILPHGSIQVSDWNTFPGQLGSVSSPEARQPGTPTQYYDTSRMSNASAGAQGGFVFQYYDTSRLNAFFRQNVFPERPDQPECRFYMKTGDCKFGAACRFHHPKEIFTNCALSPMGLPLRPGEPICSFYSRFGMCKFGPNCKFDHAMGTLMYTVPTSFTADVHPAVWPHPLGPSPSLTEGPVVEAGPGKPRRLSLMPSGEENLNA